MYYEDNFDDCSFRKVQEVTKMKKVPVLFLAFFSLLSVRAFSQTQNEASAARPYVLEITYFHGRPLSYVRIGGWVWGGLIERIPDWKPTPDFPFVKTVKVASRYEGKKVKIPVSYLDGKHLEKEFPIAEYFITEDGRTVAKELANFGNVPFQL